MTIPDDELTQLRSEVDSLRAEVAALKRSSSAPVPTGRISRAGLLRAAGLAAAGAAAGAVALPAATPALADNGSNLIAGQDNQATAATSLTSSVLTDAALRVSNYYTGPIDDYSDALQAYTFGAGLAALYGRNDATGGSGVIGYSGSGIGGTFSGGEAPIRLQPASTVGAPTADNHQQGELYVDANGVLWLCTASGSPGTWAEIGSGSSTSGAAGTLDTARYHQATTTAQSIPTSTLTVLNYDTRDWDTDSLVTTGSGWRFTVSAAGKYRVSASALLSSTAWSGTRAADFRIYKNGSDYSQLARWQTPGSVTQFVQLTGVDVVPLAAGDYIDIRVNQNTPSAIALYGDVTYNYIAVERIDGYAINPLTSLNDLIVGGTNGLPTRLPAVGKSVLGTDSSGNVGWTPLPLASLDLMRAYPSTGGSFASGAWVKVPLDTTSGDAQRAYDPHGNFDTTNHRFTAPAAGYYRIAAQVLFNISASSVVVAAIYRNGSALLYGPQFPTTSSYTIGASTISDVVYLASGDYIELWGVQTSGATKAVNNNATDTYLSVQRVA